MLALACKAKGDDRGDELEDELLGILVTPADLIVSVGGSVQLQATGLLPERESLDLTPSVEWRITDRSVAKVSDRLDEEGLLTAHAAGSTEVFAVYEGVKSPSIQVTVTDAGLERLTVSPTRVDIDEADAVQLTATGTFSDGNQGDVTGQVRWITGDGTVAQFDGYGLLVGVGEGSTTVSCAHETLESDTVTVEVSAESADDGGPNLSVSAASGAISGGYLDLAVTVANEGDSSAAGFWVDVFIDPSGTPAFQDTGDAYEWVDYVGPGSAESVAFQVYTGSGQHTVYILVDTNEHIEEEDESDNAWSTTLSDGDTSSASGPNLEITYFDYLADSESINYYVDIENTGSADADWFFVDLFLDRSSTPELYDDGDDYTIIDGLEAGGSGYAEFLIDDWCYSCSSWVMVDGYDNVEETDEDDNVDGPLAVDSE